MCDNRYKAIKILNYAEAYASDTNVITYFEIFKYLIITSSMRSQWLNQWADLVFVDP